MHAKYNKLRIMTSSALVVGIIVMSLFFTPYAFSQSQQNRQESKEQQWEFNLANGAPKVEIQWSRVTGGQVDSSPSVADVDGDGQLEVLIRSDDLYLYCLDAATGRLEWKFFIGIHGGNSPSLADVDEDGQLEVILPAGSLYCIDAALGVEEWSISGDMSGSACIADVDGDGGLEILVVDGTAGAVRCLNGSTGVEEWMTPNLGFHSLSSPSAADVDDDSEIEILCGTSNNRFYSLNGQDGTVEWYYTTSGTYSFTAAVANIDDDSMMEIVFGTSDGHVYCLDGDMGDLEWDYSVGAYSILSTPCIADAGTDRVLDILVGTQDNHLHCIDGRTGTQKWTRLTSGDVDASPTVLNVDGDLVLEVFVGSDDGAMYCIDTESGDSEWIFSTAQAVVSSPFVGDVDGDGRIEVIFGSNDRNIYCLEILEGPESSTFYSWIGIGERGDPRRTGCFCDGDGDSLTDNYEAFVGTNKDMADSDGDFFNDYMEFVLAIDPHEGGFRYPFEEWSLSVPGLVPSSPAVADVNGDGHLDIIAAFAGLILCLDGASRTQLWNHTHAFLMIPELFVEDVNNDALLEVVMVSQNVLYCYVGATGVQLWNYTAPYSLADAGCVIDVDSDGIFEIVFGSADSRDQHVYCVDGSTGQQIWNFTTGELVGVSPSAADLNHDGKLEIVFGSWDNTVYCLNASNGEELWRYTSIVKPAGYAPVIADIDQDGDYEVFVSAFDKYIHCINGANGTLKWKFLTGDYTLSSATVVDVDNDGKLEAIVPSRDGKVYCLNSSGGLIWTYVTGNNIHGGASVADIDGDGELEIIIGSTDKYLYCIDGKTGEAEWKYHLGDWCYNTVAVIDFDGDNTLEMIVTTGWQEPEGRIICLSIPAAPIDSKAYPWPGIAPLGDPAHKGRYIDTDLDLLIDEYELAAGSDVFSSDPDTDLLSDYQEFLQSSNPNVDSVPPSAIDDITISDIDEDSFVLSWTAPGENGDVGIVTGYVVKWSSIGPITEENWDDATIYSQDWIPLPPGSTETRTLTGLISLTTYWIAVLAYDDGNNYGAMSNSPSVLVKEYEIPSSVSDLSVSAHSSTWITLTWTAPGDDGVVGTASGYIVKYSTTGPISEVNWAMAIPYDQSWTPLVAGSIESRVITGLTPSTSYWFAIVAFDDAFNYGELSNVIQVVTAEGIPPSTVSDLVVVGQNSTSIFLSWTAPGDDADSGTATGYILKFSSEGPITAQNWDTISSSIEFEEPLLAGATEVRVVNGLLTNTTYWFALVVFDEVPNYSGISNLAYGRTTSVEAGLSLQFESGMLVGTAVGITVVLVSLGLVTLIRKKRP